MKHSRFGYRRAHALLRREGSAVNHKRVYRLWRREGLLVRRRTKKKLPAAVARQERPFAAERPDNVWCVDFLEDRTLAGRKLRFLSVTDEFTRESLALEVDTSITAERVSAVLKKVILERGDCAPAYLRCDNGPEFIALALRGFLHRAGVATAYIEPGSPWQNGFAESFHGRFRDEFLDQEVFVSALDAQVRTQAWRRFYNEERPHSSLGYQTPSEFAACWRAGNHKTAETNFYTGT